MDVDAGFNSYEFTHDVLVAVHALEESLDSLGNVRRLCERLVALPFRQ